MKKVWRKTILNKKGFTLVELIVAIAIIAILSSVVMPSMSSVNNRQLQEQYRQACISVLDNAEIITEAINGGSKKVSGFQVVKTDGTIDYNGEFKNCLKLENFNGADYDIICFNVTSANNGSTGTLPASYSFFTKDIVAVYICNNAYKDKYYPCGAIYFKKDSAGMIAMLKYDYVDGTPISMKSPFKNPYN